MNCLGSLKRLGPILCLALAVVSAEASEREPSPPGFWELPQLMALMAEVASRSERFTESKSLAVLTEPLVLTGSLSYRRPDRLEKHVLSPYEEHLIVEGDKLTLINKDGKKSIALHKYPVIQAFVESIRGTLAGDADMLRRHYQVTLGGDRGHWTLTLKPLDPQLAEHVRTIALTGSERRVTRVDIQEAAGDTSAMVIDGDAS